MRRPDGYSLKESMRASQLESLHNNRCPQRGGVPNAVTGRFGGRALLVGGALWVIAMLAHAGMTPDMAAMATVSSFMWGIVHWGYLVDDLLLIAGLVLFFRHLEERGAEGWGALAVAAGILAFTLDAASTGIPLFAFPAAAAAGDQTAYDALVGVQGSIGSSGATFFVIAITLLGAALLRAGGWRFLAYIGIALGIVEFGLMVTGIVAATGLLSAAIYALVPLWVAVLGFKVAGTAPAAGTAP